jgi:predicted nuclease of predicted toxin-antitoxin system
MRILLDECVPARLAARFDAFRMKAFTLTTTSRQYWCMASGFLAIKADDKLFLLE